MGFKAECEDRKVSLKRKKKREISFLLKKRGEIPARPSGVGFSIPSF